MPPYNRLYKYPRFRVSGSKIIMPYFRKRTYATYNAGRLGASNGTRAFKRRRFTRNKRIKRSGGRRTTDYTSLNLRGHAVGFRGRKTSRRAYKRHIWNSTVFKTHYRSILTLSTESDHVTPSSFVTGTLVFHNMYRTIGAEPFWTAAGGAQEIDQGDGVPEFGDEIILRGGKFTYTISNRSTNDIKVKLWRFTTGNNPDLTLIPGDLAPQDKAWDPSVIPDFYTQVGKPFMAREVVIEGGNSYTFVTRFKSQKIDQNAYENNSRSPYIMALVSNVGNSVANDFEVNRSYNLSFSGDVSALAP